MKNIYQATSLGLKTFFKFHLKLSLEGKNQHNKDRLGLTSYDPGIEIAIKAAVAWLCDAQDNSLFQDGGVAYRYSLIDGWGDSYPETTGYIIPTMINYAHLRNDEAKRERAKRVES